LVDGLVYHRGSMNFNFKCDKSIDIGAYSEAKSEVFNGEISYV
jgi:hypothetical protein